MQAPKGGSYHQILAMTSRDFAAESSFFSSLFLFPFFSLAERDLRSHRSVLCERGNQAPRLSSFLRNAKCQLCRSTEFLVAAKDPTIVLFNIRSHGFPHPF